MNKKKILSIILASTLILSSFLVGCGKKQEAVVPTKAGELKTVDLTWYLEGGGGPSDEANKATNAAITEYVKDRIHANINIQLFDYASYGTKISTMIASGEKADLVWTSASGSIPFASNVEKGSFLPLDDMLTKYGTNISKVLGPVFLEAGKVGGKTYGIPVNKDRAHERGFMFNKTMVDKYKFDITKVKTLEDLEPMLKTIKDNEKGNIVTNLNIGTNVGSGPFNLLDFDPLSGDNFVPLGLYGNNDPSNTKIFNFFESPEVVAQLNTVRKFNQAGYVRSDAPTLKNDSSDKEGKNFVSMSQFKPNGDKEKSTDKAQFVQQITTKPIATNNDISGSMMAITRNSENPERAMMFLDLMYSDKKLVNMVTFGLEGTNFTLDGDTMTTTTPFYPSNLSWKIGNQFLNYLKPDEDPKKWETLEAFNQESLPMNSLGFTFDSSSLTTEMASIVNVSKEYQPVILTGSVDPTEYLKKYNDKMKEAGLDKVIAEMQKQYDAFLAAKNK